MKKLARERETETETETDSSSFVLLWIYIIHSFFLSFFLIVLSFWKKWGNEEQNSVLEEEKTE